MTQRANVTPIESRELRGVNIKTAASIIVTLISCTLWITGTMNGMKTEMKDLKTELILDRKDNTNNNGIFTIELNGVKTRVTDLENWRKTKDEELYKEAEKRINKR